MATEFKVYKPVIKYFHLIPEENLEPNDELYVVFTVENKNPHLSIVLKSVYFTVSYISEKNDFIGDIAPAPVSGTYRSVRGKYRRNSRVSTYDFGILGSGGTGLNPLQSADFRYELQTRDRMGNRLSYPTDAELDVTFDWSISISSSIDGEILKKQSFVISKD